MSTPSEPVTSEEAPRVIGPLSAFSIVAGSMIGVGIFIFSDDIAAGVGTIPLFFGMILLGGFFSWSGAVACGELGAMMPKAGGDYTFQRAAYGPSIAFASGWVLFAAIFAGSVATLAVAVCQYELGPLFGYSIPEMLAPVVGPFNMAQVWAVGLILLFTVLNDLGTQLSARAQTLLTIAPIALMVAFGLYALIVRPDVVHPPTAAEVATLPYIILGATFIAVLGLAGTASSGSPDLGFDAGTRVANALGAKWLAPVVLVVITAAIVTSINATVMAGARVGYAMARSGAFWAPIGKLSGKRQTPRRALWFGTFIALLIVLTGTAEAIGEMTSLAMFVTGSLTVGAMYVLRRKRPDMPRPYRANAVLPAIYILLALCAIAAKLAVAIDKKGDDHLAAWYPLIGVGILAVTWVGHLLYSRKWKQATVVGLAFLLGGLAFADAAGSQTSVRAAVGAVGSSAPVGAVGSVGAPSASGQAGEAVAK